MRLFKAFRASASTSKVTRVSDRPPTILSPFGEGYCRVCRFVVGLDEFGMLDRHTRGGHGALVPNPCKGSGKTPPKLTPYSSRLSAFRFSPRKVDCPVCGRNVAVLSDGRIQGHPVAHSVTTACLAGWHTVEHAEFALRPRDHTGERG